MKQVTREQAAYIDSVMSVASNPAETEDAERLGLVKVLAGMYVRKFPPLAEEVTDVQGPMSDALNIYHTLNGTHDESARGASE